MKTHTFKCLKSLKPNNVKFINQANFEMSTFNEKKINEYLGKKIEDD